MGRIPGFLAAGLVGLVALGLFAWRRVEPAAVLPSQATRERPFRNSLGMKFVPVPGTDVHFCVWETRVRDYAAFAAANPGTVDMEWKDVEYEIPELPLEGEFRAFFHLPPRSRRRRQGLDHPVVNVSWEDAQAFCRWLSAREGRTYRLPTDHEWSLAVGLDMEPETGTPAEKDLKIPDVYPWGTAWPPPRGAGNYARSDDGFPFTAPVGRFAPNRFGLHDLGGNVWEWVEDPWEPASSSRVLRGASWGDGAPDGLLSSFRDYGDPGGRADSIGFRCVLVGLGVGER